jgi:hypothetical protein
MFCGSLIENQCSPSLINVLRPAFKTNKKDFGNVPLLMEFSSYKKGKGKRFFFYKVSPPPLSKKVKNVSLLVMGES